ncbi:hypothetical protein V3C99_007433, partial [Haemonchus contortus]
ATDVRFCQYFLFQNTSLGMCKFLLCCLAIVAPPLAVLFDRGCRREFWLNCLLTLLFFIPGIIHAFIVILSPKHHHRHDSDHHHHHHHHHHQDVIETSRVQYVTQPVVVHQGHHHHHTDEVIVTRPEYLTQGVVTYPQQSMYPTVKEVY